MTLDELLRKMAGNTKGWNTPENFARTIVRLAVRRFGFAHALEATAFVDGMGDLGIDGLAMELGDEPLLELDDVATILAKHGKEPPTFRLLFVQSKRPDRISQDDIILFGNAVKTFLTLSDAEVKRLKPSRQLGDQHAIYDTIRQSHPDIAANMDVSIVFGYGGIWKDFSAVNVRRESALATLHSDLPHARFEFEIWGADHLLQCGERYGPVSKRKLSQVRLLELPPSEAPGYIGYVDAQSLVDLVSTPEQGRRKKARVADDFMFGDNVRAFLGVNQPNVERENPGAVGLKTSLERGQNGRIVLGHNGVVIVADTGVLSEKGDSIELTGAQVVNGCQTSHVLVSRSGTLQGCTLPVKIVLTEDEALKDMIALASNTQAEVDSYDMLARLPNVRALEPEFSRAAISLRERIWFQRRRNEPVDFPSNWEGSDWSRVVRPRHLLDAFAATMVGRPEMAHASVHDTLDLARNGVAFHPEHDPTLYRALAWMIVTGRRWARRHRRNWHDRTTWGGGQSYPARHQYVCALWHLIDEIPEATALPDIDRSRPVQERFDAVIGLILNNGEILGDLAGRAVDEAVPAGRRLNAELVRTRAFTEAVIAKAKEIRATQTGP